MIRKFLSLLVLASTMAALAMASPVAADDATIVAYMTGAAERPGPGDPNAVGRASITIDDAANRLCLTLQWANVDGTLSGLHIHFAPPTAPGPVVVPFAVPTGTTTPSGNAGTTVQCVTVADEALLDNIAANPQQYYINLHSIPLYPGGALRGQLQRA